MSGCDDGGDGDADGERKDHEYDNYSFGDDAVDVENDNVVGDGDVLLESELSENQSVTKHGQTN